MKRFFSLLLVLVFVLSATSAFAAKHLFAHYSLFVDGEFYNSFFNAGFEFDTQMYDFYLYDDFSGGLLRKEEWYHGKRTDYGLQEVSYSNLETGSFKLTFKDGSSYLGYWDQENDEDLWLSFSDSSTYFRLTPVHSFDIQKDMVSK